MYRLAIALFLAIIIFACSSGKKESEWTILVYMAADNSLNEAAIDDINEMETAVFSEDINIIIQIDSREGNFYNFYPGVRRYRLKQDEIWNNEEIVSELISSLGELDTGDPYQLSSFANWGFSNYPSRKRALIIWSHGNGWYDFYNKFCPDNFSNTSINIPTGDFKIALSNINYSLNILLLDACNMQTLEVIDEVDIYTDYIIASEDNVCSDGFPYSDIFTFWEDYLNVEPLCIDIVDTYVRSYQPGGSQYTPGLNVSVTASCIDTELFPNLKSMITQFSSDWQSQATQSYFTNSRDECQVFNDLDADVDIKELFTLILEQNPPDTLALFCSELLDNINEMFIAQEFHNYLSGDIGTASIWYPDENQTFDDLRVQYENLDFSETGWTNFLSAIFH